MNCRGRKRLEQGDTSCNPSIEKCITRVPLDTSGVAMNDGEECRLQRRYRLTDSPEQIDQQKKAVLTISKTRRRWSYSTKHDIHLEVAQ